jgi:hypothetical protein
VFVPKQVQQDFDAVRCCNLLCMHGCFRVRVRFEGCGGRHPRCLCFLAATQLNPAALSLMCLPCFAASLQLRSKLYGVGTLLADTDSSALLCCVAHCLYLLHLSCYALSQQLCSELDGVGTSDSPAQPSC